MKRTEKNAQKSIFEPITSAQEMLIDSLINHENGLSLDGINDTLTRMIHVPWVDALSKQEAMWFIDYLKGIHAWEKPMQPRKAGKDDADKPSVGLIRSIREMAGKKESSRDQFADWLTARVGVRRIKDLDNERALRIYKALRFGDEKTWSGKGLKHDLS